MNPTYLIYLFEQEWIKKYEDLKYFHANSVITDIAYWKKIEILPEERERLLSFMVAYLKEHPVRFQFAGLSSFRVMANISDYEKKSRERYAARS